MPYFCGGCVAVLRRPVVPGHEDEYLITQTLTEYLAHVHLPAFDGVIFQSVQRRGGANMVLFGRDMPLSRSSILPETSFEQAAAFPAIAAGKRESKQVLSFPVPST